MSRASRFKRVAMHGALFVMVLSSSAVASPITLEEVMSTNSSVESIYAVIWALQSTLGFADTDQTLTWTGTASGGGASFSLFGLLGGEVLSLNYAGTLTGTVGVSDMNWFGTWSGTVGAMPFDGSDTQTYVLDPSVGGYNELDILQDTILNDPTDSIIRGVESLAQWGTPFIPYIKSLPPGTVNGAIESVSNWLISKSDTGKPADPGKPEKPPTPTDDSTGTPPKVVITNPQTPKQDNENKEKVVNNFENKGTVNIGILVVVKKNASSQNNVSSESNYSNDDHSFKGNGLVGQKNPEPSTIGTAFAGLLALMFVLRRSSAHA